MAEPTVRQVLNYLAAGTEPILDEPVPYEDNFWDEENEDFLPKNSLPVVLLEGEYYEVKIEKRNYRR